MTYFSDEQIQQAIDALNRGFPEIWERVKDVMRYPFADNDETITGNLRAMHLTFSRLPFVAGATGREHAMLAIIGDVPSIAAAEVNANAPGTQESSQLIAEALAMSLQVAL
jgi:hypothetical protein